LRDVTLRALEVLGAAHAVAAEDTRVTRRLLDHHGIAARLLSLHEHNERARADTVARLLSAGHSVALVSDAGTPAVSDPGARLVADLRSRGFRVVPVPGPSAALAALSVAGEESPHFLFYGFLPAKRGARREALQALKDLHCSLVFYEAPHRIAQCVADLEQVLGGERRVTFARELTKIHETVHSCRLAQARDWLARERQERGEFVLVVAGAEPGATAVDAEAERVLALLLEELPLSRAADLAARITGAPRKALYARALGLKGRAGPRRV
jgi:16S rRNA (cytidine1402-2'-O)-methyltransferase